MVESVIFMQKIILTDYVGTPTRAWERGLPLFALQTEGDIATFWLSDMKRLLMPVHLALGSGILLCCCYSTDNASRKPYQFSGSNEILDLMRKDSSILIVAFAAEPLTMRCLPLRGPVGFVCGADE